MVEKKQKDIKLPKVFTTNTAVTIVICLVVGFIVGFLASSVGSSASEGSVKETVKTYIDENFLKPQGANAEITSVESKYGLYLINFNIVQDGEVVQEAETYATKDGNHMIIGQVFDMSETIQDPEQQDQQPPATQGFPKADKPNVKMFVMTFCPFGQQAENGLGPAIAELGNDVDWEPHFVIYSNYGGGGPDYCFDEDSKYCSMHGIDELVEGVRQLCIYRDNKDKWWSYVSKINEKCSLNDINDCWKDVAKEVALDTDKVEKCVDQDGMDLLAAEAELNEEYGVRGSPAVFINDAEYSGGRSPGDYLASICSAFNQESDGCGAELATSSAAPTGGCG
jgi:protein-disulfide isomerase